jgi:hypothetical protein
MCPLGILHSGQTLHLLVSLQSGQLEPDDRLRVEVHGAGLESIAKSLHTGDPDFYVICQPARDGPVELSLRRDIESGHAAIAVRTCWRLASYSEVEREAIEVEPNDTWQQANPLRLGRDVYGTADDVDYLDNPREGKSGLDWFRFEVKGQKPALVYFQLDLLDRDVPANLRVYTVDAKTNQVTLYRTGRDPMEIVHDRERERYSKHLSRTFPPGTYYLEVNANHPDYVLRTRVLPVPPYDDPALAVEAGAHYIMNVGDAWFAQVPREGHAFVRSRNVHETATRCTACHASTFPTEAVLAAQRSGYPIRSKSSLQYVMDRIASSITPLYGDDGLYWQRFIAVPLQSQGEQGDILAEFERTVSGRETGMLQRFGPFLRAAWLGRVDLPADEQNGVLPLESKFAFAWRDWRVLHELARRSGRDDDARATAHIASILSQRAADLRAENLQDRIGRLHAWWLIDRVRFASKIRRETGALLAFQNPDGGWHENVDGPGPSAVYATGQLVDTLLEIGLPRDHPAIARALRYLMTQQQEFGGWIQETTHETFRTPMRETRYAVMALARAFPRPGAPLLSWGNRDGGVARLPRTGSLVETLDDLENLWDVPTADQAAYARQIAGLLDDPEPLVRASAAACLGRLGRPESAEPLVGCLGDPSKIVWRTSAWALRRLGNQGAGIEATKKALDHPDPAVRRGALRIFAYQFHGMDSRLDLGQRLLSLAGDPDLWSRLQAIRSLRQWFYRTSDVSFQRRIMETTLSRMASPDSAVVRKNLSENLYIMLDENLGGGVSLQKNIAELPPALRLRIMEARRSLERDVLLGPVLDALEHGNLHQRLAVLQAFDGSFLRGRFYARQPEAMLDVGNDREFGFLYEPPLERLEKVFSALLTADLPEEARSQAIQLCHFFKVPDRTHDATILARIQPPASRPPAGGGRANHHECSGADKREFPTETSAFAHAQPDAGVGSLRLPGFEKFRRAVNPLFYEPGDDGHSCANCHATHAVLRIAEVEPDRELDDEQLMINYTSALKVTNLNDPESSLILRKPRSPAGSGEAETSSPTGLTHVGGPRWDSTAAPAYQAILSWIREMAADAGTVKRPGP